MRKIALPPPVRIPSNSFVHRHTATLSGMVPSDLKNCLPYDKLQRSVVAPVQTALA